jgi:hypothetical protein
MTSSTVSTSTVSMTNLIVSLTSSIIRIVNSNVGMTRSTDDQLSSKYDQLNCEEDKLNRDEFVSVGTVTYSVTRGIKQKYFRRQASLRSPIWHNTLKCSRLIPLPFSGGKYYSRNKKNSLVHIQNKRGHCLVRIPINPELRKQPTATRF